MSEKFIDWVCHDCGINYGKWYTQGVYKGPSQWMATYHKGTCEICGKNDVSVTEVRDYGGLVKDVKYRDKNRTKRKRNGNTEICK